MFAPTQGPINPSLGLGGGNFPGGTSQPTQQLPAGGTPFPQNAPVNPGMNTAAGGSGANPAYPNLSPTGTGGTLNPGQQHPYSTDPYPILAAPGAPNQQQANAFNPSVFSDPYLQGINTAVQTGNWASQALPAASQFQQSLYSPNLSPMAQTYLQSAAQLSNNQLNNTQAQLAGMFENNANSSSLAPAMLQAANTSSAQLGQLAGQLGMQQQQLATQNLGQAFGTPLQAAAAGQQSSQGLYGQAQSSMYGDSSYPLAVLGSNTVTAPTIVSQPGTSSSKGK